MGAIDLAAMIGMPEPWARMGLLEAAFAALSTLVLFREAARGGERPPRFGAAKGVALAMGSGAGALLLVRASEVVAAGHPHARGVASLAPVLVFASQVAAGERASRAFRERLRNAACWSIAAAILVPAIALGPFVVVLVMPSLEVGGSGGVAIAFACVLAMTRLAKVPPEGALAVGALLGSRLAWVRSLGAPGGGARLRGWEDAWNRLAALGGERSHRVAVALTSPNTSFVLDWLRPPSQLVIDRSGVMRLAPAMPAPELADALAKAPHGVLSARELHPYVVGSADVHAALRALELREASAAALLRDHESKELVGILYAIRCERSALTETEARALRRLADLVAASIVDGSEPAIAARLKGV